MLVRCHMSAEERSPVESHRSARLHIRSSVVLQHRHGRLAGALCSPLVFVLLPDCVEQPPSCVTVPRNGSQFYTP